MSYKRFSVTLSILAVVYWSFAWWGRGVYFWAVHRLTQFRFAQTVLVPLFLAGALAHIIYQVKLFQGKKKLSLIAVNIAGIIAVCIFAIFVSLLRNSGNPAIISEFFRGLRLEYGFGGLIHQLIDNIDAEGMDLMFCFFLALISGDIISFSRPGFNKKEFIKALAAWFVIILISEMVIQQFFIAARTGSIGDIFSNMAGVLIGLFLSLRFSAIIVNK